MGNPLFRLSLVFLLAAFMTMKPASGKEISLDDFLKMIKESKSNKPETYLKPWKFFSDFHIILKALSDRERARYENIQQAQLKPPSSPSQFEELQNLDLKAFNKAYPIYKSAFENADVLSQFYNIYLPKYSYGFRRWSAWSKFRLVDKFKNENGLKLAPLHLKISGSYSGKKENTALSKKEDTARGILWLGVSDLMELALCQHYKPAISDLVYHIEQGLVKPSPDLRYLIYILAKQNNILINKSEHGKGLVLKNLKSKALQKYNRFIKAGRYSNSLPICKSY